MCFLECQKGLFSEHPSGVKVLAVPKSCSNLYGIVFIGIFHSSWTNIVGKHLSQSDPKFKDCLLTPWRLIRCILLIVERNSSNQFKRNYLKKQKQFLKILLHFWNLHKILHMLKKTISLMAEYFGNYWLRKMCFLEYQKEPVSEHPSGVKVLAVHKHCSNLHSIVFILIFL